VSDRSIVNQLIAAAAASRLIPLGLQRKGRSRSWFSDEGWWLINVEFQASVMVGTYLNIGAMWLWDNFDAWSFADGNRLWWRADGTFTDTVPLGQPGWTEFLRYDNAAQFDRDIRTLVNVVAQRVLQLREQFADPCTAARALSERPTRLGEDAGWHAYNTGAAAGLCGDPATARRTLSTITGQDNDPQWVVDRRRTAEDLIEAADDRAALQRRVLDLIAAKRQRLGLPPLSSSNQAFGRT
jgi:hypothetical protein